MHHYPLFFGSYSGGTVTGDFVTFDETTSEAFWTTLPEGFAFAMIVWLLSAVIGTVFSLVKKGC